MDDFKRFLEELQLKPSTIRGHLGRLQFLQLKVVNWENRDSLLSFLEDFKKTHAPSYCTSISSTIRRWGQFKNIEELKTFPMFGKKTMFVKQTMTPEEIERFLQLPPPVQRHNGRAWPVNPDSHRRWTLFFKILAYTGMRTGEVAHLTTDDVDLNRQLFILRDTKTNTPRIVPIPNFLVDELKAYLWNLKTNYLFPSSRGGNHNETGQVFDNVDWHYNFHTRLKRLGIERKGLTPYSLRHSFITKMISKNVNLFNIQAIVGHKNIKTTAQYVHLSVDGLRGILNDQ